METQKINCYVSYCVDEKEDVVLQSFLKAFDDTRFHSITKSKGNDNLLDYDVFIAIVTQSFLKNEVNRNELEIAFEFSKPILCLLAPSVKNIEDKDCSELGLFQVGELLQIIVALTCYILPCEPFEQKQVYKAQSKEIHEIKELVDDVAARSFSFSSPPQLDLKTEQIDLSGKVKIVKAKRSLLLRCTTVGSSRMVFTVFNQKKKDYEILVFGSDFNLLASHNAADLSLEKPSLIASNTRNEILIVDEVNGKLNVYDEYLTLKNTKDFGLRNYSDMTIDSTNDDVYLAKSFYIPSVQVIDFTNKRLKPPFPIHKQINISTFKPRTIKVHSNSVYIVNACSFEINPTTRQVKNPEFGESYIYVFDKASFQLQMLFDFKMWAMCQPWGLFVTADAQMYTTAYSVEDKDCVSCDRFLCRIDQYGNLLECHTLADETLPHDLIYLKGKLFIIDEDVVFIHGK